MLFHNTLRKYTLALLSTFNDLEVQYKDSSGVLQNKKVPIKYSSREKARLFDEHDTSELISGNYNVLPRISLNLSTIVKSPERSTNKFVKLNPADVGEDLREFTYNAVAYEFTYDMSIQCRGMNEAGQIIEQITTKFNPTYTVRINEVPNAEPTSVPITLLDVSLTQEEYEEISTNIVTLDIGLAVKGQFYPPVRNMDKIKNVDIFLNDWNNDDYNRAILFKYDTESEVETIYNLVTPEGAYGTIIPQISEIFSADSVVVGEDLVLEVMFTDYDNKLEEMIFVWSVTGSSTITTGNKTVVLSGVASEVVTVSVLITDVYGNTSGTFTKDITVV